MRAVANENAIQTEEYVARRSFEGLFDHGLPDDPWLRARLRALGYDRDHPRDAYPVAVWQSAVKVAAAHVFPELPQDEALRQVGHAFVHGFSRTLVGEILARAAAVLGPERVLARVPSYMKVARSDVSPTVTAVDHHLWRLTFSGNTLAPFVAGCVEAMVGLCNVKAEARLTEVTASRYDIEVRW